jgi:hypothetical protein
MTETSENEEPLRKTHPQLDGLTMFSALHYTQRGAVPVPESVSGRFMSWGGTVDEAAPLALALLTDSMRLAARAESASTSPVAESTDDTAARLHRKFAEEVLCPICPQMALRLPWYDVQAWIDEHAPLESGEAIKCIRRIREFENLLGVALNKSDTSRVRRVPPELWEHWNIEGLAEACIAWGHLRGKPLRRFVDHLMDLKFKLYCLIEVDLPAYADAVKKAGLDGENPEMTPQGLATRLSEEVTLIVKSRAVWESVMDVAYWHSTGHELRGVSATDEQGDRFKSKTARFFPAITEHELWAPLGTFEPVVERLNNLRTREIHNLSRVRANFTNAVLQPIDQCVELVNLVLTYVFDHFIAAIAVRSPISYDVVARTQISLGIINGSDEDETP